MNVLDSTRCPTVEEMGVYIGNPLFEAFVKQMEEEYRTAPRFEYSKCSLEPGWNVKFKKGGRTLCTIYPREQYFVVMVVVGRKEKEAVEDLLPTFTPEVQGIYHRTREGNGQRWLMVEVEEADQRYEDVLRLIAIRRAAK